MKKTIIPIITSIALSSVGAGGALAFSFSGVAFEQISNYLKQDIGDKAKYKLETNEYIDLIKQSPKLTDYLSSSGLVKEPYSLIMDIGTEASKKKNNSRIMFYYYPDVVYVRYATYGDASNGLNDRLKGLEFELLISKEEQLFRLNQYDDYSFEYDLDVASNKFINDCDQALFNELGNWLKIDINNVEIPSDKSLDSIKKYYQENMAYDTYKLISSLGQHQNESAYVASTFEKGINDDKFVLYDLGESYQKDYECYKYGFEVLKQPDYKSTYTDDYYNPHYLPNKIEKSNDDGSSSHLTAKCYYYEDIKESWEDGHGGGGVNIIGHEIKEFKYPLCEYDLPNSEIGEKRVIQIENYSKETTPSSSPKYAWANQNDVHISNVSVEESEFYGSLYYDGYSSKIYVYKSTGWEYLTNAKTEYIKYVNNDQHYQYGIDVINHYFYNGSEVPLDYGFGTDLSYGYMYTPGVSASQQNGSRRDLIQQLKLSTYYKKQSENSSSSFEKETSFNSSINLLAYGDMSFKYPKANKNLSSIYKEAASTYAQYVINNMED